MVQILPRPESSSDRFAKAFGGLGSSLAQDIPQELLGRAERKKISELIGQDVSNIRNPDTLKQLLSSHLEKENQSAKLKGEYEADKKNYEAVKKAFGEDFANVWLATGQGERTALTKAALEARSRGLSIEEFLAGEGGDVEGEGPHEPDYSNFESPEMGGMEENPETPQMSQRGELKLPDYTNRPKGFTPKEWATQRTGWDKSNTEALTNARDRLKGNKRDKLGTKKLQQLNDSHELPEGLDRWIVNPKTGEVYGLAQLAGKAPKAAQEWVKEIARFGNRAKDAYGSRVTNFDLMQYMKQFPSLLNTPDGRKNILRMMEINYELDSLYDTAVQKIIDQKGAGNIPPSQVDRIARSMIKKREEKLFDEYLNIDNENDQAFLFEGLSDQRPSLEDIFSG